MRLSLRIQWDENMQTNPASQKDNQSISAKVRGPLQERQI
jgi:hypothetical protein